MDSELLSRVLTLDDKDKVQLIERLLDSLSPASDGIDESAFQAELDRRSAEIDDGTAELVSWSDLKNEKW